MINNAISIRYSHTDDICRTSTLQDELYAYRDTIVDLLYDDKYTEALQMIRKLRRVQRKIKDVRIEFKNDTREKEKRYAKDTRTNKN